MQIDGKTYEPSQANNFYIFPAVGLAIVATEAKRVPDEILIEAARATADQLTSVQLEKGMLFPPQGDILNVSIKTAISSAEKSFALGLARVTKPDTVDHLVGSMLYKPVFADVK